MPGLVHIKREVPDLELPKECSLVFYYQENSLVSILSSLLETRTQFSERPKVTT